MTRVLVTGAGGSIGFRLTGTLLLQNSGPVFATDIDSLDVRNATNVDAWFEKVRPSVVYHLAGAKHAPQGELDPAGVAATNYEGTANILRAAGGCAAKVVIASTCKACDPETAYGASKLIAERMVLNAGGVVARLYNVRETSGNVFRTWENIPEPEPIPWTDCERYFVTLEQAVNLIIRAADLPSGRYTLWADEAIHMRDEARRLYPDRKLVEIPRRRGDRRREPLCARSEILSPYAGLMRITSPHDPA